MRRLRMGVAPVDSESVRDERIHQLADGARHPPPRPAALRRRNPDRSGCVITVSLV